MITTMSPLIELDTLDQLMLRNYPRALAAFYQAAVDTKLPVALWRYPNSHQSEGVVDFNGTARPTKIDLTEKIPGFAFAPFINEGGKATLFIKAGLQLTQTKHHCFAKAAKYPDSPAQYNQTQFFERYQNLMLTPYPLGDSWPTSLNGGRGNNISTKAEFCTLVEEAIRYIHTTGIKKIVVSRAIDVALPAGFNAVKTFEVLCQRYPHAFISLVAIPGIGTWIGASPEILLGVNTQSLCTVSLAGTQAKPTDIPLDKITWGEKEIEEQALVSDYIRDFFQDLGLRDFTETGPHTISAGNIVHLQTKFKVELSKLALHNLANQILDTLHPTSAVCGMPRKEALSFILEKEKYNRAFYSGFLGPVHLNNQSHLFVNLRCMQLQPKNTFLYIGAGITAGSIPRLEWEETILKAKTLLAVL